MTYIYIFSAVLGVSLISFVGVSLLLWGESRTKRFLPALVSFAAGALLGDVFLHILPEILEEGFSPEVLGPALLVGVWAFFLLERVVHYHHGHGGDSEQGGLVSARYLVLVGDGLHNFLDGLVIAAAFLVSPAVGFATAVAVLLHELPQEFGDFALLLKSGLSSKKALFFNFLSALPAFVGAGVGVILGEEFSGSLWLLVLAASGFLYISMSDLIPQMHQSLHKQGKNKWWVDLAMLILGGLVMAMLLFLE